MQQDIAMAIMISLGIKPSAIEIYRELSFLLSRGLDRELFISRNLDRTVVEVVKDMSEQRIELLGRTRYATEAEFIADYSCKKKEALERMFGEYISDSKLKRLTFDNPSRLYQLHIQNPKARFMKLMELA